ncbi:uncharacterized protein PHACADRAFT_93789 [Phanerochaete carnosa HHB-10118-sp]|uniref:Major facilitator superfamily (MFS) profile domain-containing protein n=1 Tax=Phanerochaete carnosa (strain HHB-10118-sp) TaxID=650164 RepID=K5UY98_PHACS|nr:uncharacterized protein PHACADRAFT_93789 [Phanerochaete carnosa HHB-10118-sp]EKM55101.1 hypothetical protein PHACADRAFT_93789 [Phanerochaete carnosa HHB-10118-sp]
MYSPEKDPATAEKLSVRYAEKESEDPQVGPKPGAPVIPDGGIRAWLVVLASFCAMFNTFGFINAWGVFQEYYQQTLLSDRPPSTMQYALVFMMGLPTGRLVDAGYLQLPVRVACAALVTATFLVAQCTQYWHFLLCQGIFLGIACGFTMSPGISVIPQWFRRKKGLAYGILGMGASFGGVMYPIVARRLIPEVGFPWAMRAIGFIQLVTLIPTFLFMTRSFPPTRNQPSLTFKHFRIPAFSLYCAAGFVSYLGFYTVLTYIDGSSLAARQPDDFSFYLVAIANAGSAAGRLFGGMSSDRFGPFNILASGTFATGILTYAWSYAKSQGALVAIAVIYGCASGVYVGVFGTPLVDIGDMQDFGQRMGFFLTIMAFGALAGPPISGAINTSTGGFNLVGVYAGSTVMAGVALMLAARYCVLRRLWGKA